MVKKSFNSMNSNNNVQLEYSVQTSKILLEGYSCSVNSFLSLLKNLLEEEIAAHFPSSCFSLENINFTRGNGMHGHLALSIRYKSLGCVIGKVALEKIADRVLYDCFFDFWDEHRGCLNFDGQLLFLKHAAKKDREYAINETVKEMKDIQESIQKLQKQLSDYSSLLAEIKPPERAGSISP